MNKLLKINTKKLVCYKNVCTFVLSFGTDLLYQNRFIFHSDSTFTNNNTPSMPLFDAHLEGFFFLKHG